VKLAAKRIGTLLQSTGAGDRHGGSTILVARVRQNGGD
jgi:hypothetical protein